MSLNRNSYVFSLFILLTSFVLYGNIYGECGCVNAHGSCHCVHENQSDCACVDCHCHTKSDSFVLENSAPDILQYEECEIVYNSCCDQAIQPLPQHQFSFGPEFYKAYRKRTTPLIQNVSLASGGSHLVSKQNGWIYGGRFAYERIKRCRWYLGVEAAYSSGHLYGKYQGDTVKLSYTDRNIEGRVGYTFQKKTGFLWTLIPYVGFGYIQEVTDFKRTPNPIQARTSFDYFLTGFSSQVYPHHKWVLGLNFKARFLFNSNCKISRDLDGLDPTLHFTHHVQYRVEIPITYRINENCDQFALRVTPFYENRFYGKQVNFPSDFNDTKFNYYGLTISLLSMF